MEAFLGNLELENAVWAPWRVGSWQKADSPTSTHPILEAFGSLLGRFFDLFFDVVFTHEFYTLQTRVSMAFGVV